MSAYTKTIAILLIFLLNACSSEDELLIGQWTAVSVTEGGDSLRLDPAEIGFAFMDNNQYTYRSTLKYEEAGIWRYDHGYLFATDTTQPGQAQRVVAVDKLTTDSLVIRMRNGKAERTVVLLRDTSLVYESKK